MFCLSSSSYYEIYNEKIFDLLGASDSAAAKMRRSEKGPALKVREHPSLGPYVEGLRIHAVNSYEDIQVSFYVSVLLFDAVLPLSHNRNGSGGQIPARAQYC